MERDRGIGTRHTTSGKGFEPFMDMAGTLMKTSCLHETKNGCHAAMLTHGIKPTDDNKPATYMFFTGMQFGMAQAIKMIAEGSLDMKVIGIDKPCDTDDSQS